MHSMEAVADNLSDAALHLNLILWMEQEKNKGLRM